GLAAALRQVFSWAALSNASYPLAVKGCGSSSTRLRQCDRATPLVYNSRRSAAARCEARDALLKRSSISTRSKSPELRNARKNGLAVSCSLSKNSMMISPELSPPNVFIGGPVRVSPRFPPETCVNDGLREVLESSSPSKPQGTHPNRVKRMRLRAAFFSLLVCIVLSVLPSAWSQERERLRVSTLFIGSSLLPLWIAQDQGYFARQGVNVELIWMQSTLSAQALLAGEV